MADFEAYLNASSNYPYLLSNHTSNGYDRTSFDYWRDFTVDTTALDNTAMDIPAMMALDGPRMETNVEALPDHFIDVTHPTIKSKFDEEHTTTMIDTSRVLDINDVQVYSNRSKPRQQNAALDRWEAIRPTITRLYFENDLTLSETMAVMERDHSHKGDVKTYKARFRKWGLDKYLKTQDARTIVRKKTQRDAVGKESVFRLKGRRINIEDALRHLKRVGYGSREEVMGKVTSPLPSTPPHIQCLTPPPAVSGTQARISGASLHGTGDRDAKLISTSDSIVKQLCQIDSVVSRLSTGKPTHITPPRDLILPEQLFSSIKSFFQGSIDGALWSISDVGKLQPAKAKKGQWVTSLFQDSCLTSILFLRRHLYVEARQLLSKACALSVDILAEAHVDNIRLLLEMYHVYRVSGHIPWYLKVLECLRGSLHHGRHYMNPLYRVLESLIDMSQDSDEILDAAWRCSMNTLKQYSVPFGQTWVEYMLSYTKSLGMRKKQQQELHLVESLSKQCKELCGEDSLEYLQAQEAKAWVFIRHKEFEKCEEIGQQLLQSSPLLAHREIPIRRAWTIEMIARAQYYQHKFEQAEKNLRHAIELSIEAFNKQHPDVLEVKLRLETWLREWGRGDEAAELAAERALILGSPIIEELL